MAPIKNVRKAKSIVNDVIDKYIELYDIPKPLFISMNKKYMKGEGGYGRTYYDGHDSMIVFNTDKYYFDEESLRVVTLHELVHCKLLIEGRQSEENIHDEVFNEEAKRIENLTGVDCITWPSSGLIKGHIYSKSDAYYYMLFGLSYEEGVFFTRVGSEEELDYWCAYMDYDDMFTWYEPGITNRLVFEDFDIVDNHETFNASRVNEEELFFFEN